MSTLLYFDLLLSTLISLRKSLFIDLFFLFETKIFFPGYVVVTW